MRGKKQQNSVNITQKRILLDFLKKNRRLCCGKLSQDRKTAEKLWQEAKILLNKVPNGANKEWHQWRTTWQDLKKNTKRHARGMRGAHIPLTNEEKEILELTNPVCEVSQSLPDIDEDPIVFQVVNDVDPLSEDLQDDELMDESSREAVEVIDLEEEDDDCNYNQDEFLRLKKETVTPAKPKQSIKTDSPENMSLGISQDFLHSINERNISKEKYYEEKIKFLQNRTEYQKLKIKLLKEANEKRTENNKLLKEIICISLTQNSKRC